MLVRIEKGSAVPVSRQIADQIRAQCLSGRLAPGTQVPSVRQMARDLGVNQNTVLRVYERLSNENLLEVRHGEGTFVASRMPNRQLDGQRQKFMEELTQLVRQGRLLGIDDVGIHSLLDEILSSPLVAADEQVVASNLSSGET